MEGTASVVADASWTGGVFCAVGTAATDYVYL